MNADLVERIRLGWIVLSEADAPLSGSIRTQPVVEVGGDQMLLGLDGAGVPCLLIPVVGTGPEENVGSVRIRNRALDADGGVRDYVVVSCAEPSLRDVFDHFLAGVVKAVEEEAGRRHPGATAADVLARWKSLFQTGAKALTRSDLAALLAELLVLEEIVGRDPSGSLAVWTGPGRGRHDMRRASTAIEVKATLSHTARQVTIHGLDQLEPPLGGELTLAWHRFEVVADGPLSVFTVADRLVAAGVSAADLYALMEVAGSPVSLRDEHDAVRFALRERHFFAVRDNFPRLVAGTFASRVPEGVDDVSYKITLPADETALDPGAVERVLDRMAGPG